MARVRREVWEKRVARWRDSGLSAKEFAAEIGVNANTLASWRWKLAQADATAQQGPQGRQGVAARASDSGSAPAPVQFVELVDVAPADASEERIEIVLAGATVRVPTRFDGEALRRVLAALAAR